MRRNYHNGFPAAISVEPTNQCNLRCPECPSGLHLLTRKTGYIQWDLYTSIIDQFKKQGIALNLYFQGEPFLHSNLPRMIHYATKNNIYTTISTNAQLFESFPAREIIESGIHRIIISADGINQETYEMYRVGGKLNKVVEAMQQLSMEKAKMKSRNPLIILQFIVWKSNQHELKKVKQWARVNGADIVQMKTAQISYSRDIGSILPELERYSRYKKDASGKYVIKSSIPNKCWKSWHSCVVTWDGNVVPCCFDKDASFTLGNIKEETLAVAWKNRKYYDFRQQIITDRKKNEMCQNCSEGLKIKAK